MAERKPGLTRPGVIDVAEGNAGTAAPEPVLVVTPEGKIAGTRIDGAGAHTDDGVETVEVKDTRSPAEIEADLDLTRAHLSATLDELSERLSPRDLARRGGQQVKARFVDPQTGQIKRGPVGAAVGGLGAVVGTLVAVRMLHSRS
jgi:hypothetical protein